MKHEKKQDESGGQSLDELRLIFSRVHSKPLGKMERVGRFVGLVAGKIAPSRKRSPEKAPEKDVA
jgi:hypothetical protein